MQSRAVCFSQSVLLMYGTNFTWVYWFHFSSLSLFMRNVYCVNLSRFLHFIVCFIWFVGQLLVYLCRVVQSSSPRYLRDLITVQSSQSTRSSALVTLLQPSVDSSLKITHRSFRYAAPHLWNKLPPTLHVPYQLDPSSSPSSFPPSCSDPGSLVDLSRGVFHPRLKTFLFSKSFPSQPSILTSG